MSKLNSRFSHLKINTGSEEYRKSDNSSKNKQKPINDINTFRIQSPKNIDLLNYKPLKISLTTPLTAKNENNNKIFFGSLQNHDSSSKAIKPSILTVFKNYSKNKNNENIQINSLTLTNIGNLNNAHQNNTNNILSGHFQKNPNLNNTSNNYLKTHLIKENEKTSKVICFV